MKKKIGTFLLYSYFFLYSWGTPGDNNLKKLHCYVGNSTISALKYYNPSFESGLDIVSKHEVQVNILKIMANINSFTSKWIEDQYRPIGRVGKDDYKIIITIHLKFTSTMYRQD